MRNGFDAACFERAGGDERVHADASHRAAVDVDGVDFVRGHDFVDLLEDAVEGKPFRRIDFDADGKFFGLEFFPEFAFRFALQNGRGFCDDFDGVMRGPVDFRRTQRFDGFRHGADVRGRGAAAAAENAHAESGGFASEKREIFRRGFRIDDAVAFALRKTGVGHAADAEVVDFGKLTQDFEQGLRAESAVGADDLNVFCFELSGGIGRA